MSSDSYTDKDFRGEISPASAAGTAMGGGAPGYQPGGLAEQVASGTTTSPGPSPSSPSSPTSPSSPSSRDQSQGSPELAQQQQSQDMMMQLKEQFQMVIAGLGEFKSQVEALAQTFPAAQQALGPIVEEAIPQMGQMILQSMTAVMEQVQAEQVMPSQV